MLAFLLVFSFAACGKEDVTDEPPKIYTPPNEMVYSDYEFVVDVDRYEYKGNEIELSGINDVITSLDDGEHTFMIVDFSGGSINYTQLCAIFDDLEIPYQTSGKPNSTEDDENEDGDTVDDSNNVVVAE